MRRFPEQSSGTQARQPASAGPEHRLGIAAKYMVGSEIAPNLLQFCHTTHEATSTYGEYHRIDCPGRSSTDNRKRAGRTFRQHFANCLEYTDLVGTAGTAARQHESDITLDRGQVLHYFLVLHK